MSLLLGLQKLCMTLCFFKVRNFQKIPRTKKKKDVVGGLRGGIPNKIITIKETLEENDNLHCFMLNYNRLTLWSQPILSLQIVSLFHWSIMALQYCASFCSTASESVICTYIYFYIYIYPPPLDLPSQLPPTPSHSSQVITHNIKLSS